MIILDEEDQRKAFNDPYTAGLTLRYPEKAAARSESPLPDYETSEAVQKLIAREEYERTKWVPPRLWKAVVIALGIYILLSIAIGVPIVIVKRNQHHQQSVGQFGPNPPWEGDSDPGLNLNLANTHSWALQDVTRCDWDLIQFSKSHPLSSKVTRTLDYPESLYVRSNISGTSHATRYSLGQLLVDINPDPNESKTVLVVEVTANSKELLRETAGCFDNSGAETGMFFFVSRNLKKTDILSIDIQVLLPRNQPRQLQRLSTYLPWFAHYFGDLAPYTTFQQLVVEGAGCNIKATSLRGQKISVNNAYGSILGTYYATQGLTLEGIKGNITANVTLDHEPRCLTPTYLTMATGDGFIDSTITLLAATPRNSTRHRNPYTFIAEIETYNAPLDLRVVHSPSTSPVPLQLNVQNNDGETNVFLDKTYQGRFYAQTKLDVVSVKKAYVSPSMDPLGLGRLWAIQSDLETPTVVEGWVGWGEEDLTVSTNNSVESRVNVVSSLSPVTLRLGQES